MILTRFKFFSTIIFFSLAFKISVQSSEFKVYEAVSGDIQIELLEVELSKKLNSEVQVTSMSWSRNPFNYAFYVLGAILTDAYEYYVVNFYLIDNDVIHEISCNLIIFQQSYGYVFINNCESETAQITYAGLYQELEGYFIAKEKIGLPFKKRFP